ncbi:virion structural protein [Acaryochloris phage A-HIS1]|nr:virion structural protein [Acaryochloris phage A-HIS1]
MTTVREIESLLGTTVEDSVLGDLGYREYVVTLPDGTILDTDSPVAGYGRPEVKQMDWNRVSAASAAAILELTSGILNDAFDVRVSRQIAESSVRSNGFWTLTRDGQTAMNCALVSVTIESAWWKCRVVVIKDSTFIS